MNGDDAGYSLTFTLMAIFVILKVLGLVTWSWWFVFLAPFAFTMGLGLAVYVIVMTFAVIYSLVAARDAK